MFEKLHALTSGNKAFLIKLLIAMGKSIDTYPNEIKGSFMEGDLFQVKEKSHKFKSSTTYLNHEELNDILCHLELLEEKDFYTRKEDVIAKIERLNILSSTIKIDISLKISEETAEQ